jgi:hypothetical protein
MRKKLSAISNHEVCQRVRKIGNKWTREQRARLMEKGMEIIEKSRRT